MTKTGVKIKKFFKKKFSALNFSFLGVFVTRLKNLLKINSRALICSFISAIALFLISYFVDNLPYSFIGDANTGQRIEQIKQLFNSEEESVPPDLLLVNVAYDRQLVTVNDEFGFHKGNIDVTDRSKLIQLLQKLKKTNYKYIVIDVSFTNEYNSDCDSVLYSLITSMDNIVIAKTETKEIADKRLESIARYSDYSTHISETNFVKYEYIRNEEPTLPYQMFLDLNGSKIKNFGCFYFFKGKLANKSVVLRHPLKLWNKFNRRESDFAQQQYYNLGSDILDMEIDVKSIAENKIVVIGDFSENDIHDTYLGKIAGPIINLNAYYALVNDNLSIPYLEILFIIFLYMALSYYIIKRMSFSTLVPWLNNIKSKFIRFIISFLSLTTLLYIVSIALYMIFGLDLNILIPTIYFTTITYIIKYRHNKTFK